MGEHFGLKLGKKSIDIFTMQRPDKDNLVTNDFEPKSVSADSNSVKVFVTLKFRQIVNRIEGIGSFQVINGLTDAIQD